jgi:hypothetical protein
MFVFSDVKHFVLSIVYVLSCVVGYDFSITTVVGSSLSPVVCRRDHELFTLFMFVYIVTGARGTDLHPLFSNFLFTNLFSIKFLYFFIISSLFPYFNLFVSIFIQSHVNNNLHVSTIQ